MHLISPLAAGIRGADNGFVSFVLRGSSTPSTYYSDFEATQQYPGTLVPLDSNGSLVAYVAVLVDVLVFNADGVTVREFVAGVEDAAVEVISPSFTGVDYTSGASGTQKPTNLAAILDLWLGSAGAADFKVLFNGAPTNLSAVFAATFFNVKTYGAQGNGVSDDRAAIIAAQTAATAVGGGIVFFPPGTYRITANISIAASVTWLGCGGLSSKIAIDSAIGSGILNLSGNAVGASSTVEGIWFGAINGAAPGALVGAGGASTGEFRFINCTFGIDALCTNPCYAGVATVAALKVSFTRCYMRTVAGASVLINHSGVGRLIVRDCDIVTVQTTCVALIACDDNGLFEGNRFDASALTLAFTRYITIAPTSVGGVTIIGNQFAANATIACTAIYNSLAVPIFDCMEYGNIFGSNIGTGCTPYEYATDGYGVIVAAQPTSGHGSRAHRQEGFDNLTAAAVSVDAKSKGSVVIRRTAGAALTINANKGSAGDKLTLYVINATGGGLTVTPGTNIIFDPGVTAGTLVLALAGYAECTLQWLPTGFGIGNWYLTAKAVVT